MSVVSGIGPMVQARIAQLQARKKLPSGLSGRQVGLLENSFGTYSKFVGKTLLNNVLSDFAGQIKSALAGNGAEGSEAIRNLGKNIEEDIADRLRWGMEMAQQVVAGAGQYLNQNISSEAVDAYPALALERIFSRVVPRGWKREGKMIVAAPDEDWPSRWAEAGAACGDNEWLPWSGDSQGGRGIALKSSGIWGTLGNLREDSLGNPYPPFAFNSGFGTVEISRREAENLGLLGPGQAARPAAIDLDQIFSES